VIQPPPQQAPPDSYEEYEPAGPGRLRTWLAADPAGHGTLLAAPATWTAGEILHEIGMTWQWGGALSVSAAAMAAAVSAWIAARPVPDWADPPAVVGPAEAAAVAGVAGAWLTAAAAWGVNAPPAWWPTDLLAVLVAGGWYGWLRTHDAVQAARARRLDSRTWAERKTVWDDLIRRLPQLSDNSGADLIEHIPTLVGEQVCLDTRGTGHLATEIRTRVIAERLGELWEPRIPRGRIDVWVDEFPGRLWIAVRTKNPWRFPVNHPLVNPNSLAAQYLAEPPTARHPLVVGLDPEDGEPFGLTSGRAAAGLPVWVPDQGGQVIIIASTKGGGKTNVINVITERATACPDVRVLQVNLTKPADMRAWSAACPANALGRHELGRARAILAWTEHYIDDWGETSGEAHSVPSPAQPHLVVIVDEVADVASDPVCKARLQGIARKCRSAGVTLIIAGQRGTAAWMGGADVRAMIDIAVVGRFARREEIDKVVGLHLDLPDLAEYGKGQAGVFMVVDLVSGAFDRGRVMKLKHPADCRRIARDRADRAAWQPGSMAEDQQWLWEVITTWEEVPLDAWEGPPAAGGDDEDARDLATGPPPLLPAAGLPAVAGLTPAEVQAVMTLASRPSGVSAGELAAHTRKHRDTARKYLNMVAAAGHLRVEGENNRNRRYFAASRPALTVLPGGEGGDAT
jgi:hypothetical protein